MNDTHDLVELATLAQTAVAVRRAHHRNLDALIAKASDASGRSQVSAQKPGANPGHHPAAEPSRYLLG